MIRLHNSSRNTLITVRSAAFRIVGPADEVVDGYFEIVGKGDERIIGRFALAQLILLNAPFTGIDCMGKLLLGYIMRLP